MDAQAVMGDLQRLYDSIPKEGVRCMKEAISQASPKPAVMTGTMRDTVTADEAGAIVQIHTNTSYARFVEDGRGVVRPVNKRSLHWQDPGGPNVFAKRAGPVAPRHFAADAAQKILDYIASFS